MHDFYKHLSVSEAAALLDSEPTFIYKLIRDGMRCPESVQDASEGTRQAILG